MSDTYRIIRQDSNCNRVIEHENLSESLADQFVKAREDQIGKHHQTVWKQNMTEAAPWPIVPVELKALGLTG